MRASLPDSRLLPLPDMKPDAPSPSAGAEPITALLLQASLGDRAAMDQLFPLVYDQLRRMASSSLRRERPDHTLGTTGLVHEAYLRLVDQTRVGWRDRAHFLPWPRSPCAASWWTTRDGIVVPSEVAASDPSASTRAPCRSMSGRRTSWPWTRR